MTPRAEQLLGTLPSSSRVIEIGPSYNPALPKSSGWNVRSIDHATQTELIIKYKNDPAVDISRIDPVDYVWRTGSLSDAVPSVDHGTFDAFIASHVIEHTPDLVAFLGAAATLLNPTGVVGLAIPDRRFCFDFFSPLTSTGSVVEAHDQGRSRHRLGTLFDHFAYAVSAGGTGAWGQHPTNNFQFFHDISLARSVAEQSKKVDHKYIDSHNWRFTPSSFQLIILELAWLALTDWKVVHITDSYGCEFIARLCRGGSAEAQAMTPEDFQTKRLHLLKQILIEQKIQIDWLLMGEPELRKTRETEAQSLSSAQILPTEAPEPDKSEVASLKASLLASQAAIAIAVNANNSLLASTSWRVTAPLRAIAGALPKRLLSFIRTNTWVG